MKIQDEDEDKINDKEGARVSILAIGLFNYGLLHNHASLGSHGRSTKKKKKAAEARQVSNGERAFSN